MPRYPAEKTANPKNVMLQTKDTPPNLLQKMARVEVMFFAGQWFVI